MKNSLAAAFLLAVLLPLPAFPLSSPPGPFSSDPPKLRAGIGLDYMSRAIDLEGEAQSSRLKSRSVGLRFDMEIAEGFNMNLTAGLSFSDCGGMVFRKLPFSLEYQAGDMQGVRLGGNLAKRLFSSGDFEMDVWGQFVSSIGSMKKWKLADLAVEGEAEGKLTWFEVLAGPRIFYRGYENVSPYLAVLYCPLWGSFQMDETIMELEGTEKKEIRGDGLVRVSLGCTWDIAGKLSLRGEAGVIPRKGAADLGASLELLFAF